MRNRAAHIAPAVLILAAALQAADSTPLLTAEEWLNDWKVTKEFTLAVAEKMPEESYAFKPSPEEMNFAQLMLHIGASSVFRFEQLTGTKSGIQANVLKASPKAGVQKYLNECFDYVLRVLPTVSPEQLTRMYKVDWVGRPEVNGRQMMLGMFVHTSHHRGQAEVYLRLKGIKPPDYTF